MYLRHFNEFHIIKIGTINKKTLEIHLKIRKALIVLKIYL